MVRIIFRAIVCIVATSGSIVAQTKASSCPSTKYGDRNEVTPEALVVNRIAGQVFEMWKREPPQPTSSVCLLVFREKTRKLVAVISADEDGNFEFKVVPDGHYRLVVKDLYHVFCTANIPLKLDAKVNERKRIRVSMRAPRLHGCSDADLF